MIWRRSWQFLKLEDDTEIAVHQRCYHLSLSTHPVIGTCPSHRYPQDAIQVLPCRSDIYICEHPDPHPIKKLIIEVKKTRDMDRKLRVTATRRSGDQGMATRIQHSGKVVWKG